MSLFATIVISILITNINARSFPNATYVHEAAKLNSELNSHSMNRRAGSIQAGTIEGAGGQPIQAAEGVWIVVGQLRINQDSDDCNEAQNVEYYEQKNDGQNGGEGDGHNEGDGDGHKNLGQHNGDGDGRKEQSNEGEQTHENEEAMNNRRSFDGADEGYAEGEGYGLSEGFRRQKRSPHHKRGSHMRRNFGQQRNQEIQESMEIEIERE